MGFIERESQLPGLWAMEKGLSDLMLEGPHLGIPMVCPGFSLEISRTHAEIDFGTRHFPRDLAEVPPSRKK